MCHLGLEDTQRSGLDSCKTLYVTSPVASLSPGPQVVAILKKRNHHRSTMSNENSRDYVDDYSDDFGYGGMESVHNSGAEDGGPDGAGMDSESSCHGKLSASKQLDTENYSDDLNDSSNHTPALKSRRGKLSLSPCKLPLPLPMEPELEPFGYYSLSTPRRRTGFKRPRINWVDVLSCNTDQIPEMF